MILHFNKYCILTFYNEALLYDQLYEMNYAGKPKPTLNFSYITVSLLKFMFQVILMVILNRHDLQNLYWPRIVGKRNN